MPIGHFTRITNYKRQTGRKSLTTKQRRRAQHKLQKSLRSIPTVFAKVNRDF